MLYQMPAVVDVPAVAQPLTRGYLADIAQELRRLARVVAAYDPEADPADARRDRLAQQSTGMADDLLRVAAYVAPDPTPYLVAQAAVGAVPGGADWPMHYSIADCRADPWAVRIGGVEAGPERARTAQE